MFVSLSFSIKLHHTCFLDIFNLNTRGNLPERQKNFQMREKKKKSNNYVLMINPIKQIHLKSHSFVDKHFTDLYTDANCFTVML